MFTKIPQTIIEDGNLNKKGPYHILIKLYIQEILKFIGEESIASPDALNICLSGLTRWIPLLANFPNSRKKLVERLVAIWSGSTADQARLNALLAIHKAASLYPKVLDGLLKKMYRAFGKACRTLSVHTLGTGTFLLNGLVEVFSIDIDKSLVVVKKAGRQLGALLQASIKHPSKDTLAKVYCWTFVWNVRFLARFVAQVSSKKTIDETKEQVLGIIQTSLCYNFVPRFYAHHYHLIGAASEICRASQSYFPASPYLLQVLKRIVSTGTKPETGKPKLYDFTTICKVPKVEAGSRSYLDCAAEEALFLIGECLNSFAYAPSYPDLVKPIAHQLRCIEGINKTWKVSKLCGTLASKLDLHAKTIVEARSKISEAAPSKLDCKTRLEIPTDKDIMDQFHKHTQRVREQRRKLVASSTENKTYQEPDLSDIDDIIEAKPVSKKNEKKKRTKPTEEDELADGVRKILEESSTGKKAKKGKKEAAVDDVLEDFDLSDF